MVQVMVKAFPWNTAPAYLVRDNDGAYGQAFLARIRTIGIRDHPISRKLPWQNPCAERLIGTLRRDCLDHVPIFGERHLLRILSLYSAYYNQTRTHLGLDKDAPLRRAVQPNGTIVTTPIFLDCTIGPPGRPRVSPELRKLIRRMSKENPMWAPHASMVNSYPDLGRTAFAMSLELVFALLQWDADTFGVRQGRAATTIRPAIWHNRHHPDPLRFASSIRPDIIFNKDRYCGRLPQRLGFVAHQIQHQSRLLASVAALVGCAPRAIAHFTK